MSFPEYYIIYTHYLFLFSPFIYFSKDRLHSEKHSSKLDAFSLICTNFANPNTKSYFSFGIKTQDYEF